MIYMMDMIRMMIYYAIRYRCFAVLITTLLLRYLENEESKLYNKFVCFAFFYSVKYEILFIIYYSVLCILKKL